MMLVVGRGVMGFFWYMTWYFLSLDDDSGYCWKSPAEKRHMHSSETANENFFFKTLSKEEEGS